MSVKNFLKLKRQQRRDFLVGAGTLIALPFLESLYPKNLYAQTNTPVRYVFGMLEGGIDQTPGTAHAFGGTSVLAKLSPISSYLNLYKGISCDKANFNNNNPHPPYIQYFASAQTGTSFDIHLSRYLKSISGNSSKYTPLTFSFNHRHKVGAPWFNITREDGRYITNTETELTKLQEKSMLTGAPQQVTPTNETSFLRKSLDSAIESIKAINTKLSPSDKIIMEKHLESMNRIYNLKAEVVKEELQQAQAGVCHKVSGVTELSRLNWKKRHEIAAEIIANSIICDSRRLFTIMNNDGHGNNTNPRHEEYSPLYNNIKKWSGKSYDIHITTHLHQNDASVVEKIAKNSGKDGKTYLREMRRQIDEVSVDFYAHIAKRLSEAQDTNGKSVLENSLIYFAGDMADPTSHGRNNIFTATIGNAGGKIKSGQNNIQLGKCQSADFQASLLKLLGANNNIYGSKNDNNAINNVISKIKT